MVCKVFCHILKERLATVVEEYNLVLEEQGATSVIGGHELSWLQL